MPDNKNIPIEHCDIAPDIIGSSREAETIRSQISRFARLATPVLISGESGTGKELVARAIHRYSSRAGGPFRAVNCGGLPQALIESELFGHVQGSFTGAVKTKNGLVDAAEGGTLFLDEIGELPLSSQSVFLRMLDSGEYYRIGDSTPQKADVRIVSATNRDLEAMAHEGTFRSDLYYRLKGCVIALPPLRARKTDIPLLVAHFLGDRHTVSSCAMRMLQSMEWSGNIRELKMTLASLAGISNDGEIHEKDVTAILNTHGEGAAPEPPAIAQFHHAKETAIDEFEKTYLTRLMDASAGNITKAAELSGLTRKHLRSLLKKYGLYNSQETEVDT